MPSKPTIPRVCRTCRADFLALPRQVSKGKAKWCTRPCFDAWLGFPIEIDESAGTARVPLHRKNGDIRGYAIIDAADAAWVGQWRWHRVKSTGYVGRVERDGDERNLVSLHRELLGLPRIADGREGDHIDRNPLNCRRGNLRVATGPQNKQNKSSYRGSTSKHRGVSWTTSQGKWHAQIQVNGKKTHLGNYDSEQEAARVAADARARLMPYAMD